MLGNIKAEFLSKKKLSPDTYEFAFLCKEPSEIDFLPGQYLIIIFEKDGVMRRKFYSISSARQNKNKIEFIVKIIEKGIGSDYLMSLNIGDSVQMQGPAGLFALRDNTKNKILIATGTGIAPMLSIIKTYVKEVKNKLIVMWGLRKNEDIYYYDILLNTAEKYDNFSFEIFISREEPKSSENGNIFHGRVNIGIDKLFEDQALDKSNLEFYISGDKNIVDSIRDYLLNKNMSAEDIKIEKFV